MIVGDLLNELVKKENLVPLSSFDNTCLSLSLGAVIKTLLPTENVSILEYGKDIPQECVKKVNISLTGLVLSPHSSVLAVSDECVHMPNDCFGLLQTKGSLARMMVSIHFCDGQVDPGFSGHITFEIFNGSDFYIKIPFKKVIGNLYIFQTFGMCKEYRGKYANSVEPTITIV